MKVQKLYHLIVLNILWRKEKLLIMSNFSRCYVFNIPLLQMRFQMEKGRVQPLILSLYKSRNLIADCQMGPHLYMCQPCGEILTVYRYCCQMEEILTLEIRCVYLNPFPHKAILQQTTLNVFCQNIENLHNWMDNLWLKVENIVAKGEIACFVQFLLLPLCFHKAVCCRGVRKRLYEGKG